MNSTTLRLRKEARALFPLWCLVTLAGLLPLVHQQSRAQSGWTGWIGPMGFLVGIPLLATLSLGHEFQHRTFSLLLSQPVSRMRIWYEKLSVMIAAVLSATLVFSFGWHSALQRDLNGEDLTSQELWVFAGAYVITTIASATFAALFTRSTMGGFVLNMLPASGLLVAGANWDWILGPNRSPAQSLTALWIVALTVLCYASVMLWLGRRALARFQVTGGAAGDDLLMAGSSMMPEALGGMFRSRPTGASLNLIRKELRLLRPLWLIALLAVPCLICATMFRWIPERGSTSDHGRNLILLVVLSPSIFIGLLAGSLPLGEERNWGTHSWNMTLPVSARRQWLIKLVTAMFTGLVCAVLLPAFVLIGCGIFFGSPLLFVDLHAKLWLPGNGPASFDPFLLLLAIFASFWCACAVNGTVRATMWVVPGVSALFIASRCGDWVAAKLAQTTGTLMDLVVSWFHLSPFNGIPAGPQVTWLIVPAVLFAVVQSYHLFRTQPEGSTLSMVRYLLPLAIVVFLCSFSLGASGLGLQPERWDPLYETFLSIERLQPAVTTKLDAAHPLQLTVEDLAKPSFLSASTRRWLGDSNITVAPNGAPSGYIATIHLASGLDCTFDVRHFEGKPVLGWRPCERRGR
jgi:ABC-type transport system involved in multi-copper enzyme maturation permease subunit